MSTIAVILSIALTLRSFELMNFEGFFETSRRIQIALVAFNLPGTLGGLLRPVCGNRFQISTHFYKCVCF